MSANDSQRESAVKGLTEKWGSVAHFQGDAVKKIAGLGVYGYASRRKPALFSPMIEEESIMDSPLLVVYCTCPDQVTAERIAETLVNERLAACVNLVPGLMSIYRWQERIQREAEWLLMIKTHSSVYPQLEVRIRALHPYEVPEIIALPIQAGSADYLRWITDNTGASI